MNTTTETPHCHRGHWLDLGESLWVRRRLWLAVRAIILHWPGIDRHKLANMLRDEADRVEGKAREEAK